MNLQMAEEIKAGENRTRTVAAILESTMKKEKGKKSAYLNISFPNWCD